MMIIHTPWSNFETAMTTTTMPVTNAPMPLIKALRRQPDPRSENQWRTMPDCDRVNDVKTPIAYNPMRRSVEPWKATQRAIEMRARATIPELNASLSPRRANCRGKKPSRARMEDRRGKSAKLVLAARMRMPMVENWRM